MKKETLPFLDSESPEGKIVSTTNSFFKKMNSAQKVLVMIFLISIISWIIFGINAPDGTVYNWELGKYIYYKNPFTQEWYQILLLAIWIVSLFSIFLFKD